MRKEWIGAVIAGLLLSACSTDTTQPQQAPPQAYNGPVVEIGGADPRYEPFNPNINQDYTANGNNYKIIKDASNFTQTGLASWYGHEDGSNATASGEEFDPSALTAAHPTLPIPSYVRVTNVANGRMLVVRVNDRGPFTSGRIIDLSKAAYDRLNLTNSTRVKIDFISVAPDGTLSGPGTIGTTVAKQSYALPSRPDLGSSAMGTPMQSEPPATDAPVRAISNSTLSDPNAAPVDESATTTASSGGGGFLQAPKPLPAGVLESSTPPPVAAPAEPMSEPVSAPVSRPTPKPAAVHAEPEAVAETHHAATTASGGGYMVQVGALSNQQNAHIWQKSLSQKFSVPGKVQTNGNMYRVQLGPFSSRQQAAAVQQRLSSEASQQSFIIGSGAK
ncbi:endolytic peptidoglycan transglycosylase RlpA [Rouxiella sp. Mn2063]|uniref:endolytic peptidoglycan transglycosylase RlpA n=1 Tax=Rouxiella sp. Mn2063 TaxID=3395262 RepID=UPI003BDF7CBA